MKSKQLTYNRFNLIVGIFIYFTSLRAAIIGYPNKVVVLVDMLILSVGSIMIVESVAGIIDYRILQYKNGLHDKDQDPY